MMQQSFAAGTAQRIAITRLKDSLQVRGWDQQTIKVSSQGSIATLQVEGDTLMVSGCKEALELAVPYETFISASHLEEKVSIENVRQVEIQNSKDTLLIENIQGDVSINNIASNVVLKNIKGTATIGNVDDDLSIFNVAHVITQGELKGDAFFSGIAQLEVKKVRNSASLQDIEQAVLGSIGNNLKAQDINTLRSGSIGNECWIEGNRDTNITLENIGNDLFVKSIARLQVNNVGNDCQVQDSAQATISLGAIGNDLTIDGAAQVQVHHTGNDCRIRDIQGNVTIGHVGNDLLSEGIGGDLVSGHIGADATLQGLHGNIKLGNVGANIYVQADFLPESNTQLRAGGSAHIVLPESANLTIRATAGGGIRGYGVVSPIANHVLLRYGDGVAQLDITVGGNIEIRSKTEPDSSSNTEWNDFLHTMFDFEHSMGQMGQDLEAEIAASIGNITSSLNEDLAREVSRNAEKQKRKVERQQRKIAEQSRRFSEKMAWMSVQINNREWHMDPERINRIIEQANNAAAEGVYGAIEAVEQALKNLSITPPMPPTPPKRPAPPTPPHSGTQKQAQETRMRHADDERAQPEVPVAPIEG